MVNAPEAVWDRILQAMPGQDIPVLWCGRVNRRESDAFRIIAYLNNHARYRSLKELLAVEGGHEGIFIFQGGGESETNLVASLGKINEVMEAEGLKPVTLDVEGRDSYWNLATPFQNVPPVQPKPSP